MTLVLVSGLHQGALGLMIGNFGGTAIVYAILLVPAARRSGFRRFDTPVLRELLLFSLPLMPANIALWALNLADRLQVQRLATTTELGSYSVAAQVALGDDADRGRVPDRVGAVRPLDPRRATATTDASTRRCSATGRW